MTMAWHLCSCRNSVSPLVHQQTIRPGDVRRCNCQCSAVDRLHLTCSSPCHRRTVLTSIHQLCSQHMRIKAATTSNNQLDAKHSHDHRSVNQRITMHRMHLYSKELPTERLSKNLINVLHCMSAMATFKHRSRDIANHCIRLTSSIIRLLSVAIRPTMMNRSSKPLRTSCCLIATLA